MPADVTGSSIYNQRDSEFEFRPGPVFANLLLGDEINRAPPKTQAALLEAMQERQVTIEGETRPLEPPFLVLATQNPIEYEGTYPLPEAQLDRFLLRIGVGYPSREHEWEMLERRLERADDEVELEPVVDRADACSRCSGRSSRCTSRRASASTWSTSSPRRGARPASRSARARAGRSRCSSSRAAARRSRGRDFVTPEDVKAVAVPALAHRLTLNPELWVQRIRAEDVVRECLDAVPTPPAEQTERAPARNDAAPRRRSSAATRRSAASGLLAALAFGRAELVALAAPFAARSALGLALAGRPSSSAARARPERQLEGGTVTTLDSRSRADEAGRAARARCSPCPTASSPKRRTRGLIARRGRAARARGSAALRPLGRLRGRRVSTGGLRPVRPLRLRRTIAGACLLKVYPRGERSGDLSGRARRRRTSATTSRGTKARGSSSPTSGPSLPATACAA